MQVYILTVWLPIVPIIGTGLLLFRASVKNPFREICQTGAILLYSVFVCIACFVEKVKFFESHQSLGAGFLCVILLAVILYGAAIESHISQSRRVLSALARFRNDATEDTPDLASEEDPVIVWASVAYYLGAHCLAIGVAISPYA